MKGGGGVGEGEWKKLGDGKGRCREREAGFGKEKIKWKRRDVEKRWRIREGSIEVEGVGKQSAWKGSGSQWEDMAEKRESGRERVGKGRGERYGLRRKGERRIWLGDESEV